ncbi:MAG TPA: hypothetical protein VFV20_10445 [Candidatus Limnocylindria bacterium]|nr:hypothetical protein [Candidatus Limnocylindria bacterium]
MRGPALLVALLATACAAVSHGGPVRDHVSFVDALRARGVTVGISSEAPPQRGLRGHGTRLVISGAGITQQEVDSYNYDPTDLARVGDASRLAEEDAARLRTALPSGPVHAYRRERVVVLYTGDDAAMKRLLSDVLGAQFAGTT